MSFLGCMCFYQWFFIRHLYLGYIFFFVCFFLTRGLILYIANKAFDITTFGSCHLCTRDINLRVRVGYHELLERCHALLTRGPSVYLRWTNINFGDSAIIRPTRKCGVETVWYNHIWRVASYEEVKEAVRFFFLTTFAIKRGSRTMCTSKSIVVEKWRLKLWINPCSSLDLLIHSKNLIAFLYVENTFLIRVWDSSNEPSHTKPPMCANSHLVSIAHL